MNVLKIGGNEVDDESFLDRLAKTVASLRDRQIVIVHGGGKEADELQRKLGIETRKVEGLRVTDEATLAVTEMVFCGRVNKRIVASLVGAGVDAIGVSGVDLGLVRVEKMAHPAGDLGRVGHIVSVRSEALQSLVSQGMTPVIAPVSLGLDGRIYNVNADHVAAAMAQALGAEALTFVTNVPGVLVDSQVVPSLTAADAQALVADGMIFGGMIPKVRAALDAVARGVCEARITDLDGVATGTGTRLTV